MSACFVCRVPGSYQRDNGSPPRNPFLPFTLSRDVFSSPPPLLFSFFLSFFLFSFSRRKTRETQRETSLTSVIMLDMERTRRQKIRDPPRNFRPSCRGGDVGESWQLPSIKRVDFFQARKVWLDRWECVIKGNISLKFGTDILFLFFFLMFCCYKFF